MLNNTAELQKTITKVYGVNKAMQAQRARLDAELEKCKQTQIKLEVSEMKNKDLDSQIKRLEKEKSDIEQKLNDTDNMVSKLKRLIEIEAFKKYSVMCKDINSLVIDYI